MEGVRAAWAVSEAVRKIPMPMTRLMTIIVRSNRFSLGDGAFMWRALWGLVVAIGTINWRGFQGNIQATVVTMCDDAFGADWAVRHGWVFRWVIGISNCEV